MKTKLMALEELKKYGLPFSDENQARSEFGNSSVDRELSRRAAISAIEADIAKPVDPFAWCIDSKNSADWCFSATESGVKLNAELMHEDCEKTEPFPVYTTPQEPALKVTYIDDNGAGRSRAKDCNEIQHVEIDGKVYWPLSDADQARLIAAACGNGEFTGPAEEPCYCDKNGISDPSKSCGD